MRASTTQRCDNIASGWRMPRADRGTPRVHAFTWGPLPTRTSYRMIQRRSRHRIALFSVPLAAALVFGLGALRTPATEGTLTLEASLGAKTLTVRKDGEIVKQYAVAIGKDEHPTPTGQFTVQKLVWNPTWVPPDAKWAQGKSAKGPGHPANPMKLWVKGILHVGESRTGRLAAATSIAVVP